MCGKNINKSITDTIQILIKYDAYAYYKVCQNDYFWHAWNISVKMIIELTKFCDQNCGYQYIKQLPVLKWRRTYTEFKKNIF